MTTSNQEPKVRRLFACVGTPGRAAEYRLYDRIARQLWESVEILEALAGSLPEGTEAEASRAARQAVAELLYAMAEGRTVGRPGATVAGGPAMPPTHEVAVATLVSRQLARRAARPTRRIDGKAAAAGPN